MRTPDFQKQEAKQSLWDMDGQHVNKKSRNKGKGRGKDKRLIQAELKAIHDDEDQERQYQYFHELEMALDCYYFGPCESCRTHEEER